jgi:large conductance mechanosensitive channel
LLLTPALKAAHAEDLDKLTWGAVKYGRFLSSIIKFIVIALVLFIIIQGMNRLKRKKDATADAVEIPELTLSEKLLTEIRDKIK